MRREDEENIKRAMTALFEEQKGSVVLFNWVEWCRSLIFVSISLCARTRQTICWGLARAIVLVLLRGLRTTTPSLQTKLTFTTYGRLRENLLATIGWTESDYASHLASSSTSAVPHSR